MVQAVPGQAGGEVSYKNSLTYRSVMECPFAHALRTPFFTGPQRRRRASSPQRRTRSGTVHTVALCTQWLLLLLFIGGSQQRTEVDPELQNTMKFQRQLIHQQYLQSHLQCGNHPGVAKRKGIPSTARTQETCENSSYNGGTIRT